MSRQLIATLGERRGALRTELAAALAAPEAEKRDLNEAESATFERIRGELASIDERVNELRAQEVADAAAAETMRQYGTASVQVVNEPATYRAGMNGPSFLRDLYRHQYKGDVEARDRLVRNNQERDDKVKRVRAEQRALTTGTGAGGEFVPPLWLEESFIAAVRPGRVTANLCRPADLPTGTDSINIPKVNTGTAVQPVNGQNQGINETDLTTTSVASSVETIAGGQTVSLQLIEQSPLNVDQVVLDDLAADYAMRGGIQVLYGSGTAGQVVGITTLSGTNAVTYTSTTPALGGAGNLYSKIGGAIAAIHGKRYLPPDAIIMTPSRWLWCATQSDANGRPLVVPLAGGPMNVMGNLDNQVPQGLVGHMLGLPVFCDPNIVSNLGTGTNQDEVIVARMADLWLWEGTVRAEAFQQTYAQNMSLYVRLYNYISFQPGRYPQSISVIGGTGLTAPSF